jgi:hypothetical protein
VRAVPFLTAGVAWNVLPRDHDPDVGDAYQTFADRLSCGGTRWRAEGRWLRLPQLLGHVENVHGDGGALAIVAPVADLAVGRYDRLATEPSMP